MSKQAISDAQLAANRANAEKSCGPKTEEGKLISSHNAVKTGLTGRTIVLPTDDVAAYQSLVALMIQQFAPGTDYESHLVQRMTDTEWRLLRIPTLEAGFLALGRKELAAQCSGDSTDLEILIQRTYEKDFRNLALQERRLRSYLKADMAELRRLQAERLAAAEETAPEPQASAAIPKETPAQPENGFEFSTPSEPSPKPAQSVEIPPKSEANAA
jgi:hypothetical protein